LKRRNVFVCEKRHPVSILLTASEVDILVCFNRKRVEKNPPSNPVKNQLVSRLHLHVYLEVKEGLWEQSC